MFALAAVLALAPLVSPAPLGPPSVCHPFRIGVAESLPWGNVKKLNGFDQDFELKELANRTAEILAASDDAFVHMETIRRASLYLNSKSSSWDSSTTSRDRLESQRRLEAHLQAALTHCLAERKGGRPNNTREALAWFDIAYLRGALGQIGVETNSDFKTPLERALTLQPKNVGMLLGAGLLHFRTDRQWSYLDRAIRLADDKDKDLRWNIVSTAGHFHDIKEFDRLAKRARREVGENS